MNVFELQGVISVDTSALVSAMNAASHAGDSINKSLNSVSNSVNNAQKATEHAADELNSMSKSAEKTEDSLYSLSETLRNKFEVAQNATKQAAEQVEYLRNNFNEYAETCGTASEETQTLYEALQKAERQLEACEAAEKKAESELLNYMQGTDDTAQSADNAAESVGKLGNETESAGESAQQSGEKFSGFADAINSLASIATTVAETVAGATAAISGAIVAGTTAAITATVDGVANLAQYGDQIDKQSQKIGISAEAYQEWDAVLQHSGTSISVLQAGMRTLRNAMDSLSGASGEAVVDQEKLATAQTKYENAMLSSEKAQIDYNAAVEKYGEDSDEAYKKALSLEKALNGVETAESNLAKVQQGETASMSNAAQALKQLGISAVDAKGNLRDEEEVFSEVITALQNMENETERTRLATVLLGRGGTELGALLNTSAEDTERMKERVHELNGVLSDEAVKASARFQDSLQDMKTGFSGLSRSMLSEFLPSFADVMDGITEYFSSTADTNKADSLIEQGLTNIAETVNTTLPKIFDIVDKITAQTDKLAPIVFNTFSAIFDSVSRSIENWDVDKAIDNALNLVSIATKPIDSISKSIVKGFTALAKKAPDIIKVAGEAFGTVGTALWDSMLSVLDEMSDGDALESILTTIGDFVNSGIERLTDDLPRITSAVSRIIETVMQTIPEMLSGENAGQLIDSLINSVVNIVTTVAQNIEPVISAVVRAIPHITDAILDNLDDIINAANTIVISLIDAITKDDGVLDAVVEMVSGVIDGLTRNMDDILLAVDHLLNDILAKLLEPDVMEKICYSVANILSVAIVGAAKVLGSMTGFTVQLGQSLGDMLTQVDWKNLIIDSLAGLGAGIIEGLGISEEFEDGVQMIEDFVNNVSDLWNTGIESLENWGGKIFEYIDKLKEKLSGGLGSKIIDFADKLMGGSGVVDIPDVTASNSSASTSSRQGVTINFTQNNTSPEALDEYEIWRQNNRAFDMFKLQMGG